MECTCCKLLGTRKCACGDHVKHIVCFWYVHQTEIIDAHIGFNVSCILCSPKMWAFICSFDWNRPATAELERHYLQHGRDNQNVECQRIDCAHATDYAYKCLIECLVQTTVVPPSWSVDVIHGSLFWLWNRFYKQSPRITMFYVFLT